MPSKFEEKFLRQSRYWINSIEIDALGLILEIQLVANPETQEIDGRLRFEQITCYDGNYHEYEGIYDESKFDKDLMPTLLGIFTSKTNRGTRYTITTDTVEISLVTEKEPQVLWYDFV